MTVPAAERGTTVVADKALRKIAERAAAEALPAGADTAPTGSATVHGRRAGVALRVALRVALPYSATALSDTVRRIQRHVTARTRALTGLDVTRARLTVTRLTVPASPPTPPNSENAPHSENATAGTETVGHRPPRRWWAQRRVPMAVATLAAATVCAAVTADVVRVHTTHHAAAAWRTHTVNRLADHATADTSVTFAGAVLVTLLGAWLILLGVTPGRRRHLPVAVPAPGWIAAVDRSTVATLLRDTVADVPGTDTVAVRVRRRRARVRATLAFGDLPTAREQATAAARATLTDCHLGRTPTLRVTVTPAPAWQHPTSHGAGLPPHSTHPDEPADADLAAGGRR